MIHQRQLLMILALVSALAISAPALAGDSIQVLKSVSFSENANPRQAVRDECEMQTRLPTFIASFAKGMQIELVDSFSSGGKQLRVEITEAGQRGNWFTGRQANAEVAGELVENGLVIGSFRGARTTMGGFAANYKGSCGFFARCVKALGKDIAGWLANPTMNARLGES